MEILFISHKYPPSLGGMEKQSYELISRMRIKHRVHAILYRSDEESRFLFFLRLKSRVKRILRKHPSIDVIHLNDGLMAAFTQWLPKITTLPICITFHGLDVVFPLPYYQKRVLNRFKTYDGFIVVSRSTGDHLRSRGFPSHKIFTIPNGVDKEIASYPIALNHRRKLEDRLGVDLDNKKILITMGRPVTRKGFSWFVSKVMPELPLDTILLMIGPLESGGVIPRMCRKLLPKEWTKKIELFLGWPSDHNRLVEDIKASGRVYHLGKLSYPDVLQTLSTADLFVMPNIQVDGDIEGFGLVALESVMRSTPVLAANIDGIPDAIQEGKNGFLTKSGDPEEWIMKIYQLLDDPQRLQSFGREALRYTEQRFNWDQMVDDYAKLFEKFLPSPNSSTCQ